MQQTVKLIDIRTFSFTMTEFDSGAAHAFVQAYTDNPDKFPGTWGEVWGFNMNTQKWEVTIGVPELSLRKRMSWDLNNLRELHLTRDQLEWLVTRFLDDTLEWKRDNGDLYQEDTELCIQVVVLKNGQGFRISTWQKEEANGSSYRLLHAA